MEDLDQLDYAQSDPRGFLAQFPDGAVLDEVQRCPELFSYLQGIVDQHQVMGEFVLTGSQQFGFREKISQSLAGRIGLLHLLPLSSLELRLHHPAVESVLDVEMFKGFYPPIHDRAVQVRRVSLVMMLLQTRCWKCVRSVRCVMIWMSALRSYVGI
ncbi:MAG: AAA family ATPase [Mariprofundus sp.]|nr:AAA family ATPase [Mariprofundus sp.]